MIGRIRISRWLIAAAVLAVAECAGLVALEVALTVPAQAQARDERFPFLGRQRPARSGGFFENLFGPSNRQVFEREQAPSAPSDYSRAPAPRKPDANAEPVVPTATVVVMGDGMADWLAYGLEDAFSDSPEVAIVRKNKPHSGLLRYEYKSDLDWWHVARDILAQEKANYVVMMLGSATARTSASGILPRKPKSRPRTSRQRKTPSKARKASPTSSRSSHPSRRPAGRPMA